MCDGGKTKKKTVNKSNGRGLIVKGSGSSPVFCSRRRRGEKVSASASRGGERARRAQEDRRGRCCLSDKSEMLLIQWTGQTLFDQLTVMQLQNAADTNLRMLLGIL